MLQGSSTIQPVRVEAEFIGALGDGTLRLTEEGPPESSGVLNVVAILEHRPYEKFTNLP
jgi:hypothetical protein